MLKSIAMAGYPRLKDKIVLITGASAGIGAATARLFAASGSHLVLGARRVDKLEQLKQELSSKHPNIKIHVGSVDVRYNDSVVEFVKGVPQSFQDIDILVNNAGLALGIAKTHENDLAQLDAMIDTNVKGVAYVLKAIVPRMIERNQGHIINISSIAGHEAYPGGSIYCASKFAVEAITDSLRKELINTNIRVTSVAPGLVETEFSLVRFSGATDKAKAPYIGIDPLTGEDIADNIVYAASRPSNVQITNITITATHQASPAYIYRKPADK